ncbi:hypothetical protein G6O69_17945 [Pseudenhygromyxa sp. WMMC2535]|nr:hypothetical protein [Pseudenhygromyxa sp. WMMC2535]NVB39731.1 hypothetical protein [Pseudenhygromyxa sp. WMMC2535]
MSRPTLAGSRQAPCLQRTGQGVASPPVSRGLDSPRPTSKAASPSPTTAS